MSRKNRNKRQNTPPSQRHRNGNERTYLFTEPPAPPTLTDVSKISIVDQITAPSPETEDNETGDGDPTAGARAGWGSRGNRVRKGLRSRILFPDAMQDAIDRRAVEFAALFKPVNPIERWLIQQMAIGSVQSDLANDQLTLNLRLAVKRVDTHWAEDRCQIADNQWERIEKAPARIARALGRTKYGALLLIDKLACIGESIASQGGLDDAQREVLFSILGIDHVLRKGSMRVPAGTDGPALAAVVEKEKVRLSTKIERSLNAMDQAEQSAARYGVVRYYDKETRNLRGDRARADRRYQWCWGCLGQLRRGVDPATIIDPETRQPINPDAHSSPTSAPEPAPPAPPPPKPAPPEPAPSPDRMSPLPPGCSDEAKEMYFLLGEASLRDQAPGEPGPVLPG